MSSRHEDLDVFDREPPEHHALCGTTHSPDDDCPDDGRCLLAGCGKRATKSLFSDTEFQYCAEHFMGVKRADND